MQRDITRTENGRFCTLNIRLENGRLSITGEEGRIVSRSSAKKEALEYWESFFEDDVNEIVQMGKRVGKRFLSAKSAARFVIASDGEFHGLDVVKEDGRFVYILESCGQITEELREWFPEVIPLLPWHLNDMKAGCEHQEKLGWGNGFDVVIESQDAVNAWGQSVKTDRKVFKDSIGAPCPTCGYEYGTQWLKRELPPEIVKLAETVCKNG